MGNHVRSSPQDVPDADHSLAARIVFVLPIATAGVWLCLAAPCLALECPEPQTGGVPGTIQETPAQISELAGILGSGDLGDRIQWLIATLRSRYPAAPAAELVNYLVTAYCPIVNSQPGLDDAAKQARLQAFASQVAQLAY